jgi:hypothetical protein
MAISLNASQNFQQSTCSLLGAASISCDHLVAVTVSSFITRSRAVGHRKHVLVHVVPRCSYIPIPQGEIFNPNLSPIGRTVS